MISSILCHEICHHVLSVQGIKEEDTLQNERLTDVCVFVCGLGSIYLRDVRQGPERGYYDRNEYHKIQQVVIQKWGEVIDEKPQAHSKWEEFVLLNGGDKGAILECEMYSQIDRKNNIERTDYQRLEEWFRVWKLFRNKHLSTDKARKALIQLKKINVRQVREKDSEVMCSYELMCASLKQR